MRNRLSASLCLAMTLLLFACQPPPSNSPGAPAEEKGTVASALSKFSVSARPRTDQGISYHGGPLMLGTTHVYYVWYGDWSLNSGVAILNNLAASIGGSPRFAINTAYSDGSGQHVSNSVTFNGAVYDASSHGLTIQKSDIPLIVADAISSGGLPLDENGVYFVLTAANVTEISGFGNRYYAYHSWGNFSGKVLKFAFVGNPDSLSDASSHYAQTISPNGNPGADHMASGITHELEEAVTDPTLSAWYDEFNYENADKCAYTFGPTTALPSGARYNMTLGGMNYLIQQNWLIGSTGGHAALSLSQVSTLDASDARSVEWTLTAAFSAYLSGRTDRAITLMKNLKSQFNRLARAGKITSFDLSVLTHQSDRLITLFQTHQY